MKYKVLARSATLHKEFIKVNICNTNDIWWHIRANKVRKGVFFIDDSVSVISI